MACDDAAAGAGSLWAGWGSTLFWNVVLPTPDLPCTLFSEIGSYWPGTHQICEADWLATSGRHLHSAGITSMHDCASFWCFVLFYMDIGDQTLGLVLELHAHATAPGLLYFLLHESDSEAYAGALC